MAIYSPAVILLFFLLTSLGSYAALLIDRNPPAVYIFGDSSADVGTNNYVPDCEDVCNFPYYGVDFDEGVPTGRWSNRYNIVDYISHLFGFVRSPYPFLSNNPNNDPSSENYTGVNFASAGSGILDRTGRTADVVPVPEQVCQFLKVRDNLTATMGYQNAKYFISRSIFIISVGANDLQRVFFEETDLTVSTYLTDYMKRYERIIEDLHDLGARKFGFVSIFPMGCVPMIRVTNVTEGCVTLIDQISREFFEYLRKLLIRLEANLEDFRYSLGNTYNILMEAIAHSHHPKHACCGFGKLHAEHFCNQTAYLCDYRRKYVFWDPVHPTDAASKVVAQELYSNSTTTYPITFCQLVNPNIESILCVYSNEHVI